MSTIDDATVIANLRETVERLIRERDFWRECAWTAMRTTEEKDKRIQEFEQKGGA